MPEPIFDAKQNPHGVKRGQTWQKPNGDQFLVLGLEMWTVRGVWQPSAHVLTARHNNRGLKHGFDKCKLIDEGKDL